MHETLLLLLLPPPRGPGAAGPLPVMPVDPAGGRPGGASKGREPGHLRRRKNSVLPRSEATRAGCPRPKRGKGTSREGTHRQRPLHADETKTSGLERKKEEEKNSPEINSVVAVQGASAARHPLLVEAARLSVAVQPPWC